MGEMLCIQATTLNEINAAIEATGYVTVKLEGTLPNAERYIISRKALAKIADDVRYDDGTTAPIIVSSLALRILRFNCAILGKSILGIAILGKGSNKLDTPVIELIDTKLDTPIIELIELFDAKLDTPVIELIDTKLDTPIIELIELFDAKLDTPVIELIEEFPDGNSIEVNKRYVLPATTNEKYRSFAVWVRWSETDISTGSVIYHERTLYAETEDIANKNYKIQISDVLLGGSTAYIEVIVDGYGTWTESIGDTIYANPECKVVEARVIGVDACNPVIKLATPTIELFGVPITLGKQYQVTAPNGVVELSGSWKYVPTGETRDFNHTDIQVGTSFVFSSEVVAYQEPDMTYSNMLKTSIGNFILISSLDNALLGCNVTNMCISGVGSVTPIEE